MAQKDWFSLKEAAVKVGRHPNSLYRWARYTLKNPNRPRRGPPFYQINGRFRYKAEELDEWLKGNHK